VQALELGIVPCQEQLRALRNGRIEGLQAALALLRQVALDAHRQHRATERVARPGDLPGDRRRSRIRSQPVRDAWAPRYIDLPGEHFAARRQVERIEASRTRR